MMHRKWPSSVVVVTRPRYDLKCLKKLIYLLFCMYTCLPHTHNLSLNCSHCHCNIDTLRHIEKFPLHIDLPYMCLTLCKSPYHRKNRRVRLSRLQYCLLGYIAKRKNAKLKVLCHWHYVLRTSVVFILKSDDCLYF